VHVRAETGESPLQEETGTWSRESAPESVFPAGLEWTPQVEGCRGAVARLSHGTQRSLWRP